MSLSEMLSRDEFKVACYTLLDEPATSLNPHLNRVYARWTWQEHPVRFIEPHHRLGPFVDHGLLKQYPHLGYLTRTASYAPIEPGHPTALDPQLEAEEAEDLEAKEDLATAAPVAGNVPSLHCSMSVVYSPTYQLPAFYCSMFDHSRFIAQKVTQSITPIRF